ncbi:unnamed protein product [Amoebophrya sp. A25]|nr:unnamed protein product [Amoebophrya sp. A25]|eukprot:GSA25T00011392001.1
MKYPTRVMRMKLYKKRLSPHLLFFSSTSHLKLLDTPSCYSIETSSCLYKLLVHVLCLPNAVAKKNNRTKRASGCESNIVLLAPLSGAKVDSPDTTSIASSCVSL